MNNMSGVLLSAWGQKTKNEMVAGAAFGSLHLRAGLLAVKIAHPTLGSLSAGLSTDAARTQAL